MGTCFVMQPFDGGTFDRRYEETFRPAIEAAGLEPYRVDKDPGVTIPIDQIEEGIRHANICFAEITLDNPNVWLELGYAIAVGKDVVLVCSAEQRQKFPFDIQHRTILTYKTDSVSGYKTLERKITDSMKAILEKRRNEPVKSTAPPLAAAINQLDGLSPHEIATIHAIAESQSSDGEPVAYSEVSRKLTAEGFKSLATELSIRLLSKREFIVRKDLSDFDGTSAAYRLTKKAWSWLEKNHDKLALRHEFKHSVNPPRRF